MRLRVGQKIMYRSKNAVYVCKCINCPFHLSRLNLLKKPASNLLSADVTNVMRLADDLVKRNF